MPQLTDWKCPQCGQRAPIGRYPVNCSCGYVDDGTDANADPTIYKRLAACETCMDYMGGERCKSIELGCRRAFRRELREGSCPRSKWSE